MKIEQIKQLYEAGHKILNVTYTNGETEKIRLFLSSSGSICKFRKNSRKYGYPINEENVSDAKPVLKRKTPEQQWVSGWNKVKTRLIESKLWTEVVKEIDAALNIGYTRLNQAYTDYWKVKFASEDARIQHFMQCYPELIDVNAENKPYIKTSIFWSYSKFPQVKKMRFVKNVRYADYSLDTIVKSMETKQPCSVEGDNGYDVSFTYDPVKNKAWYSEEYRGCGNGHYYLALDSTHALFVEDD